jgi:hypothetical protein
MPLIYFAVQAMNSRQRAVNHASQLGAELARAVFKQTLLCLLRPEPAGISIRFLGSLLAGHFAEIRGNSYCRSMAQVSRKGSCLNATVRTSLLDRL